MILVEKKKTMYFTFSLYVCVSLSPLSLLCLSLWPLSLSPLLCLSVSLSFPVCVPCLHLTPQYVCPSLLCLSISLVFVSLLFPFCLSLSSRICVSSVCLSISLSLYSMHFFRYLFYNNWKTHYNNISKISLEQTGAFLQPYYTAEGSEYWPHSHSDGQSVFVSSWNIKSECFNTDSLPDGFSFQFCIPKNAAFHNILF